MSFDHDGGGTLSRRDFLARARAAGLSAAAAGALASTLTFPLSARAAEQVAVSFFVFAGGTQSVIPKRVAEAYQKAHENVAIEIYESSNAKSYPLIKAARQANPDKPLVNFGYFNTPTTFQGDIDDIWLSLDESRIPNMKNILPSLRRPDDRGAAFCVSPVGILYHKEHVPEPPTSWEALFTDPKLKGRVIGYDYSWAYNGALELALLKGGNLAEPEAAFEFLAEHAKQFLTIVTGTQQAINLFAKGEAWACIFSKGIQMQMVKAGAPVGFSIPEEGAIAIPLYQQILKGSSPAQQKVGEDIIDQLLSPELMAEYCETQGYAPAAKGVTLPPEMAADPAFQPEVIEKAMPVDWAALAANDGKYRQLWDREVKTRL